VAVTTDRALYRIPPPSYQTVTSFKPSAPHANNSSLVNADMSHSLVNGQLMRSISVTHAADPNHGIQVRRLLSNTSLTLPFNRGQGHADGSVN